MILSLFLLPGASALLCLLIRRDVVRRGLLVAASGGHAGLVAWCWADRGRF